MGASIIEMVIVLVAAAAMTIIGIQEDIAKRRASLMASEGQNEAVINSKLADWVSDHYATLLAQYTSSGSATLMPPTLDDLATGGYLKTAYRNGPFWGGQYTIDMTMVPAGCTATAGDCHVSYRFYPSLPLTRGGQPDVRGASQIAQAGGNDFGFSKMQNPAVIAGLNGSWTAANPIAGAPAAAILATNGDGVDGNSVYIRRDGSLTWTGDQNVNHVSMHNVHDIDAEGTIAAPLVAASNADVSNAIRTPSTLLVQNAAGSAPAPIDTGDAAVHGNETVDGYVKVGDIGWPRTSCSNPSQLAGATDHSGLLLACQLVDGVLQWMPVGGSKLWYGYTRIPAGTGYVVDNPGCPAGGTPEIVVTGQSLYVNPSAAVNYPYSGTGPWTVYITDGTGAVIPNASAVAQMFCGY